MKEKVLLTIAIVLSLGLGFWAGSAGSGRFAGTTHLTGLEVGEDGLNSTGTTTISKSYDGFVLWGSFTVSTSSPVRVSLTNPSSLTICDARSLAVYVDSVTQPSDSFKYVVGTTTASGLYSANLMASTTVATSTDVVNTTGTNGPFLLTNGMAITVSVGDYNTYASSTYYGNWAGQISLHCWLLGA